MINNILERAHIDARTVLSKAIDKVVPLLLEDEEAGFDGPEKESRDVLDVALAELVDAAESLQSGPVRVAETIGLSLAFVVQKKGDVVLMFACPGKDCKYHEVNGFVTGRTLRGHMEKSGSCKPTGANGLSICKCPIGGCTSKFKANDNRYSPEAFLRHLDKKHGGVGAVLQEIKSKALGHFKILDGDDLRLIDDKWAFADLAGEEGSPFHKAKSPAKESVFFVAEGVSCGQNGETVIKEGFCLNPSPTARLEAGARAAAAALDGGAASDPEEDPEEDVCLHPSPTATLEARTRTEAAAPADLGGAAPAASKKKKKKRASKNKAGGGNTADESSAADQGRGGSGAGRQQRAVVRPKTRRTGTASSLAGAPAGERSSVPLASLRQSRDISADATPKRKRGSSNKSASDGSSPAPSVGRPPAKKTGAAGNAAAGAPGAAESTAIDLSDSPPAPSATDRGKGKRRGMSGGGEENAFPQASSSRRSAAAKGREAAGDVSGCCFFDSDGEDFA